MSQSSIELWQRFRSDDPEAAELLFRRYVDRLIALADSRLSRKLRARLDAEDVVQSAYRSFFVRARAGRFSIQKSGDLWRLLATMTIRKLQGQVEHHSARRRSYQREQPFGNDAPGDRLADEIAAAEPQPSDIVAAAEQTELLLAQLEPAQARAVEMRLQDFTLPEIAAALNCSERTVRRWLHEAKRLLEAQLALGEPAPSANPESATSASRASVVPEFALQHRDYLLRRHLGSGGMGRVYAAVEKRTGRAVAVKVLKKARLADPFAVERFLQEAQLLGRLQHPGIVAVHGLGRMPAGGYFMVMDLIDGHSLDDVTSDASLSPERAAELVAAIAEAIEFAHGQGVIHCDLKPANVLLGEDGRALVTDFGLARLLAGPQPRDFVAGTASYMAPEQIDAAWGPIDRRTDVFGLGGLLCFLLTGEPPHAGHTRDEIFEAAGGPAPIRGLTERRAGLPLDLAAIAARCLAKKPADRYPVAQEVATELVRWLIKSSPGGAGQLAAGTGDRARRAGLA